MGILTRLFGQTGRIRFEGTTESGRSINGKMSIEVFNMDRQEVEERLKQEVEYKLGERIKNIKVVQFIED